MCWNDGLLASFEVLIPRSNFSCVKQLSGRIPAARDAQEDQKQNSD
ncbi:hypothetical protein [Pelotomaculum sp. FP]